MSGTPKMGMSQGKNSHGRSFSRTVLMGGSARGGQGMTRVTE